MSDIADISAHSRISSPLYSSTLNSNNGDIAYTFDMKSSNESPIMNNMKANPENGFIKTRNNHNLCTNNNNDDYKEREYVERPLKLKVVITDHDQNGRVMNVLNDLSKARSPIVEKNSTEFLGSEKALGEDKQQRKRPIMGRNALLKKANIEPNDSLIIYDLITEKYNGAINHYLDRSSQRRRLRGDYSYSDNYSDTSYSSPPLSVSSISTPGSVGPDERVGFPFPVSERPTPKSNDFGFIVSTDEVNAETTVEDADSLSNTTCATEKSGTSVSDYDPKKFLDDALGEITNLSVAYGISNSETADQQKPSADQQQQDISIGTSNLSTLISRASSLCTSASSKRNIKKNCSVPSTPQLPDITENDRPMSYNFENSYLEHLMKELSLQNEIMFQVSKALNYCKATKKFESSVELLEAERILLVAYCTKEALTKEIQNAEDDTYEKRHSQCCGEVTLTHLTFHLKNSGGHRDFTEHFIAILTCGSIVLASEIITVDETGEVHAKRIFNFPDLAADFEISVSIFAMRVGNKPHANQDQKINCPSPKRIFCHLKKGSKKYKVLNDLVYIKPSSFTLWGKCELRSRDLSKAKNNELITMKMLNTPLSASLSGDFSLKINTNVKLRNKVSGFLTIGTDNEHGCTIWNRRWCVLEGSVLKYWNYPSEEVSSPLGFINLNNCLEQYVHVADRSICARPRTLMLPVRRNEVEKKYLLSADNSSNMEEWEKEINDVVCTLRVWNRIDV